MRHRDHNKPGWQITMTALGPNEEPLYSATSTRMSFIRRKFRRAARRFNRRRQLLHNGRKP